MAIADDFQETVLPRLRAVAKTQAFFVALDIIDAEEARNAVSAEARKAGSALLKPADQDRLLEWISNTIWNEMEAAHDRVGVLRQRVAAAERDDPIRYYDGLARGCSNPEAMRWTLAAISPAYRKHLLERCNARKA
jgi:hypothetical protein